jgi:O-methyltransferase involved in polyketide biosynthesis
VKFLNINKEIDEAWEIDMEQVMHSKSIMFHRLQHRRPNYKLPNLIAQDLTDTVGLKCALDTILQPHNSSKNNEEWYTIFIVEGVLIYLKEDDRRKVLFVCSQSLKSRRINGSFLFADRIRKLRDPSPGKVEEWLKSDGWDLVANSFCVHPGKARHMGAARVRE